MEFHCELDRETGELRNFYNNPFSVLMCGADKKDIVKAQVEEASEQEATHWAFKNLLTSEISFVYKTEIQVKICSADFFKSRIKKGEGQLIRVSAKIIQSEVMQ